jgi:hypothetical protein
MSLFSKKVKLSLLQAVEAPRVVGLPQYLDKQLTHGGKVVSPTRRPLFTPQFLFKIPGTHFC